MRYTELKNKIQKRINDFPMGFAFNKEQFEEVKIKLNCDDSELVCIGGGSILRKSDRKAFDQLFLDCEQEKRDFLKDDEQLKDALIYELGNHEYGITYNSDSTFEALGIETEDIDLRIATIAKQAIKEYLVEFELCNN